MIDPEQMKPIYVRYGEIVTGRVYNSPHAGWRLTPLSTQEIIEFLNQLPSEQRYKVFKSLFNEFRHRVNTNET